MVKFLNFKFSCKILIQILKNYFTWKKFKKQITNVLIVIETISSDNLYIDIKNDVDNKHSILLYQLQNNTEDKFEKIFTNQSQKICTLTCNVKTDELNKLMKKLWEIIQLTYSIFSDGILFIGRKTSSINAVQ